MCLLKTFFGKFKGKFKTEFRYFIWWIDLYLIGFFFSTLFIKLYNWINYSEFSLTFVLFIFAENLLLEIFSVNHATF